MRKNKFDLKIKETLKDHPIDLNKGDWAAMNEKLNQEFGFENDPITDKEFDNSISNKLNSEEQDYDHAHWDLLVERLEQEDAKNFHIVVKRFLKYTAVLLLLLSIWNWQGSSYFQSQKIDQNKMVSQSNETKVKVSSDLISATLIQENSNPVFVPSYNEEVYNPAAANSIEPEQAMNIASNFGQGQIAQSITPISVTKNAIAVASGNSDQTDSKLSREIKESGKTPTLLNLIALEKVKTAALSEVSSAQLLAPLAIQALETERIAKAKSPSLDFANQSKKHAFSIGAVASPDLFLIRSPEDPIFPQPSYYTGSRGLSGGVVFGVERNNVELQTGITYSSVSYQPRDYSEVYSSNGKLYQTSLDNIFFNAISIPVNFKIQFDLGARSKIYTSMGTTFNTIINSNFDIADNTIPQPAGVPDSNMRRNPLLEQKDFEEGIFEGGSIFENTFFTADFGIGYLRELDQNWSVYLQPTIHTQFTEGIGPNSDFLHKVSLYAGVQYSL